MGYRIFWNYAMDSVEYFGYSQRENEIVISIIFSLYLSVFSTITGNILTSLVGVVLCLCSGGGGVIRV